MPRQRKTPGVRGVSLYTLTNRGGAEAGIITYGGAVVPLKVPDRRGRLADVVLGFDDLGGYLAQDSYIGALVGRYANRIGGARTKGAAESGNDQPRTFEGGEAVYESGS